MLKKMIGRSFMLTVIFILLAITGCSGVSEQEIAELEALRSEVKALDDQINTLKSQKNMFETEIAEKNARLDECTKLREETQQNLKKIGY